MAISPLFTALQQMEQLAALQRVIANNIGGGNNPDEAAAATRNDAAAAAETDADAASANTTRLPAGWGSSGPLQRPQAFVASQSLIGLRPAQLLADAMSEGALPADAASSDSANAAANRTPAQSLSGAPGAQNPLPPAMAAMLLTTVPNPAAAPAQTSDGATQDDGAHDADETVQAKGGGEIASRSNLVQDGGDPLEVAGPAGNDELDDLRHQGPNASGGPHGRNPSRLPGAARAQPAARQAEASHVQAAMGTDGGQRTDRAALAMEAGRTNAMQAMGQPGASEPDAAARRADAEVPVLESWSLPATGLTERTGIIASCILNAAMIPGWPLPKPIELAAGRTIVPERQPSGEPIDENETLVYLANMGASRSLLDRIRKLVEPIAKRLKLLLGLAVLATLVTSALHTLNEELAALEEELRELEENSENSRRGLAG